MRGALALVAMAACARGPSTIDRDRAAALFTRVELDTAGVHGLSGLAVDADGTLWTVAERGAAAFAITLDGARATAVRYPIEGVPDGEDLEAVAIAARGFASRVEDPSGPDPTGEGLATGPPASTDGLWVGTEGRERGVARVFALVRDGARLVVTGAPIELRPDEVGVDVGANHGAEGVCAVGDVVAIALETAGQDARGRWAPVVVIDRVRGTRVVHRVRLSSATGKLSALDCWRDGETLRAMAIERHFEVTRLLRFTLDAAVEITPTVALDLGPVLRGALNLEGLARLPDGRMVAVVDNQYRSITGPDELLVFAAP